MDEGIAMMNAVWSQDPVTISGNFIEAKVDAMRMLPMPTSPIPIWIGGTAERQIARAIKLQGWHGSRQTPEEIAPIVERLWKARPDPEFIISMRIRWNGVDVAALKASLKAYEAIGVQHILVEPENRERDDWDAILEGVGKIAGG
jgi:alkanesulfonate monooxygenase SsuD/methylene tetrahydromethanopterin reductase-like flavin-dependent oxidoreductase (luciferase family)